KVGLSVPLTVVDNASVASNWRELFLSSVLRRTTRRFASVLSGISLRIEKGDRVALIGRNGAGKTSLLHVLTGAYVPTTGSLDIQGRRKALMNISLGLNPNASVYENIFLRGVASGMSARQLHEHMDDIIEFSELSGKLGSPLYTLSSGQRMRLAFSISTAFPSDIMIMDEWIGAGDAHFIKRAKQRLLDRIAGSQIVVLASHNNQIVKEVCNRAVLMQEGSVVFDGGVAEALKKYSEIEAGK
ncbi:ABC transporter ATP-binding protein, partial [Rhizobiaceae sp. 2RAB30]